jgi:flagellar hook assembly protein FlgD
MLAAATPPQTAICAVHPNPFNPTTRISFNLKTQTRVRLAVYDVAGRLVRTLLDGPIAAGPASATWDGRDDRGSAVASGVYYGSLIAGQHRETMRMVLLK